MNKLKITSAAIALAMLGGTTWFYRRADGSERPAYRTAAIERASLKSTVSATGKLGAVRTVQVGTQVSGQVSELFVDFNDKVKKGQLLARIDPKLQEQAVQDAQAQLERALTRQAALRDVPLGEMVVNDGLISRTDLQTALAHKMGYPLVDLTRFPIDPKAAAKLPQRIATGLRMMPLLLVRDQLIVAVDKPARVMKLKGVNAMTGVTVTPVLASRMQIMLAQDRQKNDIWSSHVADKLPFFASTI